MSYRRKLPDRLAEHAWRDWLTDHSPALARLGLPLELYSSRVVWEDFVFTGSCVYGSGKEHRGFDSGELTLEEQQRLHAFLECEVDATVSPGGLLGFLRLRAAHGWAAPFR